MIDLLNYSKSEIKVFDCDKNQKMENGWNCLFELTLKDEVLGYCYYKKDEVNLFEIDCVILNDFLSLNYIKPVLIQSAIAKIFREVDDSVPILKIIFKNDLGWQEVLTENRFEYDTIFKSYIYSMESYKIQKIQELKGKLKSIFSDCRSISCSFSLAQIDYLPFALDYIISEYNQFLWGRAEIARLQDISSDEFDVISKYVFARRALEVGCGSGRLIHEISKKVDHLVASDFNISIINSVAYQHRDWSNVDFIVDDICHSSFESDSFDLVMFWENGLGAMLTPSLRSTALNEMIRLLQVGGRLILGLRQLVDSPIDNLMVAPQNSDIIGIYHTFSSTEIMQDISSHMKLVEMIDGSERSAGGKAFFLILEKKAPGGFPGPES